jgi:glucose/arabinose dehydrogenase
MSVRRLPARTRVVLVAALSLAAALASPAQALRLHKVARFDQPAYLTAPQGDRRDLFVVERAGQIEIVRDGRKLRRPFLDIRGLVDLDFPNNQFRDQGGLVALAFAPDYRRSGRFYVFYSHRDGTLHVDEFRRGGGSRLRAARSSRRTVIAITRLGRRTDLGGDLGFGPDGYLYVGFGQGRHPASAQDLGALTGKILRIDPRPLPRAPYGVPADNPFVTLPGARPEIFAYGLRMPWRFSFDPQSGDLIVGEVGEERFEEIDVLAPPDAGANLGWPFYEGRHQDEPDGPGGVTFPALAKPHSNGFCAIVGGYLLRGRRLPSLRDRYLYGDVCTGRLRSVRLGAGGAEADRSEHLSVPYLDSFGRDGRGRLYAVSLDGPVFRISG